MPNSLIVAFVDITVTRVSSASRFVRHRNQSSNKDRISFAHLSMSRLPSPPPAVRYRAARLVLRAYPAQPGPDWALPLYRQYLCLGRDEYLTEYLAAEGSLDRAVMTALLKR